MMKKIFVIDWILILAFILVAFTGIKLHIAGHVNNHDVWHSWAVFHILASLFYLIVMFYHIKSHFGWYKGFIKNGIGKRSKVTLVLSILFVLIVITGIILLPINDVNSGIGHFHYVIGIIVSIISVMHLIKRIPILCKSLKKR